jgi:predicted PurR-regulated permease PerM
VRRTIDISWQTIAKVIVAVVLVWLWLRLWQWVLVLLIGAFIAVGVEPVVAWLERRRVGRAFGAPLVIFAIAGLLAGFVVVAGAELIAQSGLLADRLRDVWSQIGPRLAPWLNELPRTDGTRSGEMIFQLGRSIVNAMLSIGVAFILALYLLLDGRRTLEWLTAFAPRSERPRVRRTVVEARSAIEAYVVGNVVTSALAAITAYVFLVILKVPAALLLALLTGLFDFIPVLGIVLSAVPMVLLAFTVSATAGVLAIVFNIAYNIVENYYISPKVYGRALPLSSLAVILAFAVGAQLGGVLGALVALPLAAIYPAVERIWLAERIGPDVVETHRRIEQSEEH